MSETLTRIASDPTKTVMCIGKITGDRKRLFIKNSEIKEKYLSQVKAELLMLIARGVNSFFFISWDYYDVLLCKLLKEIESESNKVIKQIIPMAVLEKRTSPDDCVLLIIDKKNEDTNLAKNEEAFQLLQNVRYLLFDKKEEYDDLSLYLTKAIKMGIEVIPLNSVNI